jgi:hypothetical protein
MTATSPRPFAASAFGIDIANPGKLAHFGSHHVGPCSPAIARAASSASTASQPPIWSPCTAGAMSASNSTMSPPSSEMSQ